jgi:hypothetical protein
VSGAAVRATAPEPKPATTKSAREVAVAVGKANKRVKECEKMLYDFPVQGYKKEYDPFSIFTTFILGAIEPVREAAMISQKRFFIHH